MDQEKETKRQAERCRALAQRIVRELTPASIQVLGGSGALAEALEKAGAQLLPENAEQAPLPCWWWRTRNGWICRTAVCTGAAGMHRCIGHG